VIQLRELDLQLAFGAPRALRENVEDQRGSIDDAARQRFFEVALLHAGEHVIEDDEIGAARGFALGDFGDFAAPREERRVRPFTSTANLGDDARACGGGQCGDLAHAIAIVAPAEGKRDDQRTVAAFRTLEHQPAAASCRGHCRGD